jgi:5'-AMP-activated protein kinase catalytic alpha subunit
MIQGERYEGIKVDIWSSGIILFAMLNGYLPFEDEDTNTLYKKVLSGTYSFHHSVSEEAKDLIQKILNNKPS